MRPHPCEGMQKMDNLDVVMAVCAIVLGLLLILNALDLETILGIVLLVWGFLSLAKRL